MLLRNFNYQNKNWLHFQRYTYLSTSKCNPLNCMVHGGIAVEPKSAYFYASSHRELNLKPICGNCNQPSSQCLNDTQVDLSRCRVRRGTHVKDGDDCVTIKKVWFTKRIGSFSDFYIDFVDSSRVVIDINGQTDLVYSCKCCR